MSSLRFPARCRWELFALLTSVAGATAATGQSAVPIQGSVLDTSGRALASARIVVEGAPLLQTYSAHDGTFRLALTPGRQRLITRRLGFRPETTLVIVPSAGLVEVRLRHDPMLLQSVTVVDDDDGAGGRRTVPRTTIRNTPTFLEADVFRALAFVPGVSQPNDLKGRLHLAGGASDETGYELDGHPLQEPFHLAGLLGSFPSAALERADVSIYHLPAYSDGRLGGVINFETAGISGTEETELSLGLVSAAATVARNWQDGLLSGLVAVRSTYLDKLLDTFQGTVSQKGDAIPLLRYRDVIGSFRLGQNPESRASITFFASSDGFLVPRGDGSRETALAWGEWMAGSRASRRISPDLLVSARMSFSRAHERTRSDGALTSIALQHDWLSTALSFEKNLSPYAALTVGLALDERRVDDRWHTIAGGDFAALLSPRLPLRGATDGAQRTSAVYAQLRGTLYGYDVSSGLRVNRLEDDWGVAPRLSLGRPLTKQWRARISYDRRYQSDAQLEEPEEVNALQPLFFLPTFREADMISVSLVRSGTALSSKRLEISAFDKRYLNRATLAGDPRRYQDSTGTLPAPFPNFERISGRAYGGSVDALWPVSSRLYLQGAYTFQRSFERVGGTSPTDWDTPHDVNAFLSYRWSAKWTSTMAMRGHSGLPITPARARIFAPGPDFEPQLDSRYLPGARNSARTAGYFRVDIGLRRDWTRGEREWSFGLNLLNASGRTNPYSYDYTSYACWKAGLCSVPKADRRGMPLLPSVFLAVRW